MFENLSLYRIAQKWPCDLAAATAGLEKMPFEPTQPTQELSTGWVPPRGEENGAVVESIGGQWIAKWFCEKRAVPAAMVKRKLAARVKKLEEERGFKVGKAEKRDLKTEVLRDLLPQAFPAQGAAWVWIDPQTNLLAIGSTSTAVTDSVVSDLVQALPGFAVWQLYTNLSPTAAMAQWLNTHDAPHGFDIDRSTELKASDESAAAVRYANHPLDIAEIREHIDQGKLPVKLAMTFDDRVSFVLTDGLQLRGIEFLDAVAEDHKTDDAGFDADVAIATGELRALLPALVQSLGGEPEPEAAQ